MQTHPAPPPPPNQQSPSKPPRPLPLQLPRTFPTDSLAENLRTCSSFFPLEQTAPCFLAALFPTDPDSLVSGTIIFSSRPKHASQHSPTMQTKPLNERLAQLEPRLRRLCEITGLPGCSLGVIHNNEETWRLNLGFRDVEQQLATQSDTVFNLNSLTKGVTAAAYACLVEDGQVTWNTRIKCILPDFSSGADQINQEITALDLLSMRTGHQPFGSLAWQGNNIVLPPKRCVNTAIKLDSH